MKTPTLATLSCLVSLAVLPVAAGAWDVRYDATSGLLPTVASPSWNVFYRTDPTPAIVGNALRMQHLAGGAYLHYGREQAIVAGVPITLETRMHVTSDSVGAPHISIQTLGCLAYVQIYADHLNTWELGRPITFASDLTTFRTIRLAYDGVSRAYVWVDDQPAFSWVCGTGGQDGINFGSYTYIGDAAFDSYWQYVAYSKEFLPVPEPSSLLVLAVSLAGIGAAVVRRRL